MRGVAGSEYEGGRCSSPFLFPHVEQPASMTYMDLLSYPGLYHLRILLPPSYPMSAPDIILLTPNGRFELGKKVRIRNSVTAP